MSNVSPLKTPNPEGELQTPSDKKDTPFGKALLDSVQGVVVTRPKLNDLRPKYELKKHSEKYKTPLL